MATAANAQKPETGTGVSLPNLYVTVEGCGVHGGTCTSVPGGTGTGADNSSAGGYGDNQAAPLTLFKYSLSGASSATYLNSIVLPQTGSGANLPVSGEYGSSSEGTLQLDGTGRYLTVMGYGVNANTFNNNSNAYSATPNTQLAQSGSLTGQGYTPIPRIVATIDAYGNVNSSTASYNVFDNNNPRSTYSADGFNFYISGQGTGCDITSGVFLTQLGVTNDAPTAITAGDALPTASCVASGYSGSVVAQDTRTVQIYNGTLYISVDSTAGKSNNRSYLGTLGTPPATSMYVPASGTFPSGYTDGPSLLSGIGNSGGTGKVTLTSTNGNAFNASLTINMSPENYFFASPSVVYIADSGSPKQSSATSNLGDGGLQKWINSQANGSGTWSLAYTLYQGLNLVKNATNTPANTSGATGLYGLTGYVSGTTVYLFATPYNINDLDPTYLYGITDSLSATTNPGTSFTLLDTAPADSNFKGVSFAPTLPAGSATITSAPSGLAFSTSGAGCTPGTYTTPVTLIWTPGSTCQLSVAPTETATGTEYTFTQWQDGTTGTTDSVTAPATSAVYTLSFSTSYLLTTSAGTGGTVSAGGYYPAGDNATVTATPATHYSFVNFTGTTTSTSNPLTVAMNSPQTITANFAPEPFGNLEQARDSLTGSTTVSQGDLLLVAGWAADPAYGAPLSSVAVYIDNNAVAAPSLGIPRPDVVAGNNNSSYLDSGYQGTYSVAGLSTTSPHTVTAVATDSGNHSTTFGPLTFNVSATAAPATPPFGDLEQVLDATTGTVPVSQADSIFAAGWVADAADGAPVSSVQVYIDSVLANGTLTLGIPRLDVAAANGSSNYTNSGFQWYFPAATLSGGTHAITVVATDGGGRKTTLGPVSFTVVAAPPFGNLEEAVDSTTGSTSVLPADTVLIAGWVADLTDGAPVSSVSVAIDGNTVGAATLGYARPDVAAAHGSRFLDSGYYLLYPASSLIAGSHSVKVTATDSGSRTTTFGPIQFSVQGAVN